MWRKHGHTYIKIKNLQKDHTFDVVWCGAFQIDIDININIDIGSLHRHRQSAQTISLYLLSCDKERHGIKPSPGTGSTTPLPTIVLSTKVVQQQF